MLLVRVSVPPLGVSVSALEPLMTPVRDAAALPESTVKVPLALKVWI